MDHPIRPVSGHYGALGVSPGASQREIEQAFQVWRVGGGGGACRTAAYIGAERAYHVLSNPDARSRHDRQIGVSPHPAWAAGRERVARSCLRRALRELGRDRAESARSLLSRAVALAPGNPHARSYLALALARTGGSLHEAARHGRFALECRPREAAFLFNLAEVYAAAGLRARACATGLLGWHAIAASLLGLATKSFR